MNSKDIVIKSLPKIVNMRTLKATSLDDSALNLALIDLLNTRQLLIEKQEELGEKSLQFSITIPNNDVKTTATLIRNLFELEIEAQYKTETKRKFYLYVRDKIEKQGILIQNFSGVATETARGVAIYNDISPIIGVNENDRYPAKTFTIIHELVHICKHVSTMCNDMFTSFSAQNEEVFCNAVAGEVLVPEEALAIFLNKYKEKEFTEEFIDFIADIFSISKEVIIRRLLDLNKINKIQYETFAIAFKKSSELQKEHDKISRKEIGSIMRRNILRETIDKTSIALCKTLLRSANEGLIDKQDISRYLRIDQKHIDKLLQEVSKWNN